MTEITQIVDFIQNIGFVGLLIVLAIPKLRALFGFTNGFQEQIDILKTHASIANSEMGDVKKDISEIKNDISDLKEDVSFIKGVVSKGT